MKNKMLAAVIVAVALIVAFGARAASQGNGSGQAQAQPSIQIKATDSQGLEVQVEAVESKAETEGESGSNAGEESVRTKTEAANPEEGSQTRSQEEEKLRGRMIMEEEAVPEDGLEVPAEGRPMLINAQDQERQKLNGENGQGAAIRNQNQEENQGEEGQLRNEEREKAAKPKAAGQERAEQRRSQVANAVQEMLKVAERHEGIGEQVRTIAQAQTQNQEKLEANLQKIGSRGKVARFFFGPNYGEAKKAGATLQQSRDQISQLEEAKQEIEDEADRQVIDDQISQLEEANADMGQSLQDSQKGFSLLGWMFRLFAR